MTVLVWLGVVVGVGLLIYIVTSWKGWLEEWREGDLWAKLWGNYRPPLVTEWIKITYKRMDTGETSVEFYTRKEFRKKFGWWVRYFEKIGKVGDYLEITTGQLHSLGGRHYHRYEILYGDKEAIKEYETIRDEGLPWK